MEKIKYLRIALVIILLMVGLSAVQGAYGLIFKNGLGMPLDFLQNTPFHSYFWPGMILGFIVGGTSLVAAFFMLRSYKYRFEACAVAGFGLLIWLFTELFLLPEHSFLTVIYFALAIAILVLTMLLFKKEVSSKQKK